MNSEKITYSQYSQNAIDNAHGNIKEINHLIHLHPHDHKNKWDWQVILEFLRNIDLLAGAKVLELGGGVGNAGYYFAGKGGEAVINDINAAYVKHAVARHDNIKGLIHDINHSLPFADNSFDLVCCLGTLHYGYVKDVMAVLEEMKRISGKYILFDLFSRHSFYYNFVEKFLYPLSNPRRFSKNEAKELISGADLEIINIASTRNFPFLNKFFPYFGKSVIFLCAKKK